MGACGTITIVDGITEVSATRSAYDSLNPIGPGKDGSGGTVFSLAGLIDEMSGHTRTIVPSSSRWNGDLSGLETDAVAYDGTTIHGTLYGCHKITIASGATVTISNATIEGVHNSNYKWAGLTCEGDATIILEGSNTIKGFYKDYPGIYVPPYKTLTIQGSGSLTATSSGYGAGIGAGYEIDCGNIVIEDGTVTATGGTDAAGIGGAFNAENGKITIGAGITKVVATSGSEGVASIGRGGVV